MATPGAAWNSMGAREQFPCLACGGLSPGFFSRYKWLRNQGVEDCRRREWVQGLLRLGSVFSPDLIIIMRTMTPLSSAWFFTAALMVPLSQIRV